MSARMRSVVRAVSMPGLTLLALSLFAPTTLPAQSPGLKIAVGDVGLGIGDVPRIDGLRINFRDRHLERVRGVNITIWSPHDDADGVVQGLALGLPLTGAADIRGIALAAGVGVDRDFTGIGLAPIGMGAGGRIRGVVLTGIGAGGGGDMEGVMIGGIGLGAGGNIRGLAVGGIGAGVGGHLDGVGIGGIGVGVSGNARGITLGGVGVGAGGHARGVTIGGVGVGVGGDATGLTVGGIGLGVGGDLRGINLAGVGIGASQVTGITIAGVAAGAGDARGVIVAPAYFQLAEGGALRGVSVSAFNDIRGQQHGLAIGILNIASELHGVQLGLINIARNKERFPVLPLMNYHR